MDLGAGGGAAGAGPAAGVEARGNAGGDDDLRGGLAAELLDFAARTLERRGGSGGELLDGIRERRRVDLEHQRQDARRREELRLPHVGDGPWEYGGEFEGIESGPWLAGRVAEEVAKLKRLPVEDVMFQLSSNACRLFDLMWA